MNAINLPVLDNISVAAPCSMNWNDMVGDERSRHCAQCELNVFNLSDMTKEEAEELIRAKQGHLCVRYFKRPDGTILTRDCPVGLAAARAAMIRAVTRIGAVAAALCAAVVFGRTRNSLPNGDQLTSQGIFAFIAEKISPRAQQVRIQVMGEICIPTPPKSTPTLGK